MRREVHWPEIVSLLASIPILIALTSEHPEWPGGIPVFLVWIAASWVVSTTLNPLLVLVHELGHALTAIALTPQRIDLVVGHVENPLTFSIGRIDVRLCLWQADGGHIKLSVVERISRPRYILIVLAGPLASAAAAIVLGAAAVAVLHDHPFAFLVLGIATICALLGFLNLVPSTHLGRALPGAPIEVSATDGLLIWRALTGARRPVRIQPALEAVVAHARSVATGGPMGTVHLLYALASHGAVPGVRSADVPLEGDERPDTVDRLLARVATSPSARRTPGDLLRGILDDPGCAASRRLAELGVDRRELRLRLDGPAAA